MAMDAAAQMGAPEDLAGTIGQQVPDADSGSPKQAISGAIQLLSRYQRNLSEIRQGAQGLSQQFPANGSTVAKILDLTDQLQKLVASYTSELVTTQAPTIDAGSSLSGLLR